jgi:peptidoglycan/LPS O-acetylase OafA/YrhL
VNIKSLTTFRGIIALVIFLFHCKIHLSYQLNINYLDSFLLNGATFMTGFFVLSGFILAHVYKDTNLASRENIFNFYIKRFARIYPVYLISTIVYLLIYRLEPLQLFRATINDLLLMQSFFKSMFLIANNGGTWSLSVEMFLYFLFPFILILANRSPKILFFAILFTLLTTVNLYVENVDYIYANPIFRIPDFLFGIGFYFLVSHFKRLSHYASIHLLIIALLIVATIFLGGVDHQYMKGNFLIAPIFAFWISLIFHSKSSFYNSKIMIFLGVISYSFYLWQFISINLAKLYIDTYPHFNINLVVFATLFLNIALAFLSYYFIEEKSRRYILRKLK